MRLAASDHLVIDLGKQLKSCQDENMVLLDRHQELQHETKRQSVILIDELNDVIVKSRSQSETIEKSKE